jgi:hypothetical protein
MNADDNGDMPEGIEFSYTTAMLKEYCKLYVDAFTDLLPKGCTLAFSELHSPREYNFTTDRITCTISPEHLAIIASETNECGLRDVIRERCTSRSGFISFYSPDRDNLEDWPQDVNQWGPAQLKLLLIAYLRSTDQEINDYDLMEGAICNGHVSSIIDELAEA